MLVEYRTARSNDFFNSKGCGTLKFRFVHLLPILIVVMILYEFSAYGFTIYASVNKVLLGTIYGLLLYIAAYIIKAIGTSVANRLRPEPETDFSQVIEP